MHPAEIEKDANRHLEIVLLDSKTSRTIPRAGISLRLCSDEHDPIETDLPYLLAEFNHYGHSLFVPSGGYRVEATISRPDLLTLESNRFPEQVTTKFSWTADEEE